MRRPLLALALLVGAVAASSQAASTAGSSVPRSTAVHRATEVRGATLLSLNHTITGGVITGVTPQLRGVNLLTKSVTARFGSGAAVPCSAGVLTILNVLTGLGQAHYTCTGLVERADRPQRLLISVS